MTPDADVGAGAGVAGVLLLLKVDCLSEEGALRLPCTTVTLVGGFFFSGALYTKGADVGIVGVMIDFVVDFAFA